MVNNKNIYHKKSHISISGFKLEKEKGEGRNGKGDGKSEYSGTILDGFH